jgi:tetratricopeptide (TPR) repeat protein
VIVVDNTAIDYSRPIVLAAPPAAIDPSQAENQARQLLDASRTAFAKADYPTAMALINQAISRKPNDAVLHEFRALILFATQQYQPAAAAVYAVLSLGPGWDWATLSSLYPNPEVYTGQLRALEQRRSENPNVAELRFLLAYHYMSCGHAEAAARELREVVRLSPKDQLSVQLLAGVSGAKPESIPVPGQPPAPARPVGAADLVGDWEAVRTDGASFTFSLTNQATYSWKYTQAGKTQQYGGAYTVADNLLILKKDGSPVMIGQVTLLDAKRFNFKLVSGNPSDPGLTFSKK